MIEAEYFIDAEFFEMPGTLIPLSLGIVSALDGRELHIVNASNVKRFEDVHKATAVHNHKDTRWIVENVLPKLPSRKEWLSDEECADKIRKFVAGTNPQFWAYYAAYDWVCFCWFCGGRMIDLPRGWPRFCRDLRWVMAERGIEPARYGIGHSLDTHNALEDARWAADVWRKLYPQYSRP